MNNAQYVEKLVFSVERILVDTSTLMSPGFQRFVSDNNELFLKLGRKIIITKAVYTEIARHLQSKDSEKRKYAFDAVALMGSYKDIFSIDSCSLSETDIAHAFADVELLSELTLHMPDYNQLLITNDRKLSHDAFDINQLESCRGRRVKVCYVTGYGKLETCECARQINAISSYDVETRTSVNTSQSYKENDSATTSWDFDWKSCAVGLSSAGVLMAIVKICKSFL